ncbi:MAG: DEAD/DEAH box helicase family protein [Clostridia bacterium]|nr:DEAD/DEAH box helicase family protein [Clostridia bacterium]
MLEVNESDLYYDDDETNDEINELGQMYGSSSDEILVACLNKLGCVDLVKMSKSSGKSCEELVIDLKGAIFQDPCKFEYDEQWSIEKGWFLRSQYCRGNIRKKLAVARRMNIKFPGRFHNNITTLKKMLPAAITLDEIQHIPLGAPWVPAEVYALFIKKLLDIKTTPLVFYSKELCGWRVKANDKEEADKSIANTDTYGVPREWEWYSKEKPKPYLTALEIFEQLLNAKTVKVYDYVGWDYERILNSEATLVAQEKAKMIIREFDKWVRANLRRSAKLEECYNEAFVGYASSAYDGSFLKFPNLNPNVIFYPHQRNAIARMLLSQENVLFAHDVGTGKTYEMCAGVHEMYRMKLSRKNLVVVPNNVLKATVDAHKYLYPNDKILAVFPKDFTPVYRKEVLEQIRDGDYVAVYMAYSSFDMIVMSKEYWLNKMTVELNSLRNAIANAVHKEEAKMLERKKDALFKKRSKYILEAYDTPWLTFDKLGIETLVVDEAHNYKNIPLDTKADNIVGMHTSGSKKCKEMLEKTKIVKKLVFATGTPMTNSLADLFVLQTYLQPDELKFRGISSFDMWINTFGERETNFEVDIDGEHLRAMTRFSKFHNLTELMSLFSNVCDFHHLDKKQEGLPVFNGYIDICMPKTKAQTEGIAQLAERIDLIRAHKVRRTVDNPLKITTDGRKIALDPRLLDEKYCFYDNEKNKIEYCAENVYKLYCQYPDTCQVIFSDIGTPKSSFNVYDSLKAELIGHGIPEHQIAFVHDATSEAARARLFANINAGLIRVVIGSTTKLGVGVNVQERLVALHHLSVPWRPADMVQREGRIIRCGNTCEEVFIFRYITEGSFDAYSWQLLENKQRFISDFLSGTSAAREADDVADAILSLAEAKALAIGNPLIKKRVETSNKLERVKMAYRNRQKQILSLRAIVDGVPAELERLKRIQKITERDLELYTNSKGVVPNEERQAFGEELLKTLGDNHMQDTERLFDNYQGFDVCLPAGMDTENPYVYVRSKNGGVYYLEMETEKPLGCAMRIDHLLEGLSQRVLNYKQQIYTTCKQEKEALADIENGNMYQDEMEKLQIELDQIDKCLLEVDKKSA